MPKPKYKYVLLHKPTGKFATRSSKHWPRHRNELITEHLTSDINDCRVFTNKSSAHNAAIFKHDTDPSKSQFEAIPCKLVPVTQSMMEMNSYETS